MRTPLRLDRDCGFVNWTDTVTAYATTHVNSDAEIINVTSDGTTKVNFGSFRCHNISNLAANKLTAAGVHLTGAIEENSGELTPYAYHAMAFSSDPAVLPSVFCAISPATVTSGAGGDVCRYTRHIHTGEWSSDGSSLNVQGVIALPKPSSADAAYKGRGNVFGIAWITRGNTGHATLKNYGYLSVRRLVGSTPIIYDRFKM